MFMFTKCVTLNYSGFKISKGAFRLQVESSGQDASPGSESEFPVGDWQKLEGMNTLFLGTAKKQRGTALSIQINVYTTSKNKV